VSASGCDIQCPLGSHEDQTERQRCRATEQTTVGGSEGIRPSDAVKSVELLAHIRCAANTHSYRPWCQLRLSSGNEVERPGVPFGGNAKACMRAETLSTNHKRTMTPIACCIGEMAGRQCPVSACEVSKAWQRRMRWLNGV
jgi:hypothetical protein